MTPFTALGPFAPARARIIAAVVGGSGSIVRTLLLTAGAMVAFAANSVLCRSALAPELIDAASYATLRMGSAALLLVCLTGFRRLRGRPDWRAVASLTVYLLTFTFAYTGLDAGFGAVLMFGATHLTMLTVGLVRGERFTPLEWLGVAVAVAGFVYLLLPGSLAPPLVASVSMTIAGVMWGLYSLRGQVAADALTATARTLLVVALLAAVATGALADRVHVSADGALLAVASGTVTTAFGYVIWYTALARLAAVRAATAQLSIPVIATIGGALLLGERITLELVLGGAAVLGGIALAIVRHAAAGPRPERTRAVAVEREPLR